MTGGPSDEGGRCPLDHAGSPGSRFCGECGAPLSWPQGEEGAIAEEGGPGPAPRLCSQGHPAEPEDAFCAVCGRPVDPYNGVTKPSPPDPTGIPSSAQTSATKNRRSVGRKKLILVGVVAIVLIAAGVAIPLALRPSGGGSTATAAVSSGGQASSSTTAVVTPKTVCALPAGVSASEVNQPKFCFVTSVLAEYPSPSDFGATTDLDQNTIINELGNYACLTLAAYSQGQVTPVQAVDQTLSGMTSPETVGNSAIGGAVSIGVAQTIVIRAAQYLCPAEQNIVREAAGLAPISAP